jgi:hypothetical protein
MHPHPGQVQPPPPPHPMMPAHPQTPQRHMPQGARMTPQPPQVAMAHASPHPGYYTPQRGVPVGAPPSAGVAPPSAKRYKPSPATGGVPHPQAAINTLGGDPAMTIEEEEDTSKGDVLDVLTPREMAVTRYVQHHEWMEEVMGSAYSTSRIKPVDLGLGLVGELESVTRGLLDPPIYPTPKPKINDPVREEKDPKQVLVEVKSRAAQKIREMEAEMQRMKETHEARLRKIKETSLFKEAEIELRGGLGLEDFLPGLRVQRPVDGSGEEETEEAIAAREPTIPVGNDRPVDDVVSEVQARTGKKIVPELAVVQHQLPEDEIVKMGGVVASAAAAAEQHQQQQHDTVMGDDHGTTLDNGTTFDLDIPTPPNDETSAAGLLDEFEAAAASEGLEDTMMDDFMNVADTPSKPATPQHLENNASSIAAPAEAAGEGMFVIPPMEGATPGGGLGEGVGDAQ